MAAEQLLSESADLLQQGAHDSARWLASFSYNGLGSLALVPRAEVSAAAEQFELSRRLAQQSGNLGSEMQALVFMAGLALLDGRRDDARRLLLDSVPLVEQQPYYEGNGYCLEIAAAYGVADGQAAAAARALGLAKTLRELIGAKVWALLEEASVAIHARVREALGDEAYDVAFHEGAQADPRAAAAAVLGLLGATSTRGLG